jgi:hypothetical protein
MEEVDRLRGEVNWCFGLQGLMGMAVRGCFAIGGKRQW